ncbi:30S ribosomal protein S30e [Candidatus Bathyarchaeota archaeon]|nr:30S ribosomal protein S30e [Candidatus Bathyarchaeota archaeon]
MPTHGSLSKAGKVRSQTPKIESITRKSQIPRAQNRRKYNNREILGRNIGQYSPNKRRFRRRRR